MLFYFISVVCGSGKTYSFIQQAYEWAKNGRRIIVLQPTKELIDETVERELLTKANPPRHKVFHGDVVSGSVSAALTDYFKQTDDEGQIVFATHQVLTHLGFWANKDTWDVFCDEELQVVRHNSYEVPNTHDLITNLITLVPHNAIYSRLKIKDRAELEKIAKNKDKDQIYETFRETAQTLLNPYWDSFVNAELFEKLKVGKSKTLSIHSLLKSSVFDGFGSVFMASANFQDSFVYRLWSRQGVEFREDKTLASSLLFQEHTNGNLITIKYADEKAWSRKRRLTKLNPDSGEKTTVMDAIIQAAKATFQDQPFLWQANKNVSDSIFDGKGKRLPNTPHGLNHFSQINNIVFLSSLNPPPDHFRFLETQGLNGGEVKRAIYLAALYQSVMRTSIRDPNNKEQKTIIVPDKAAALYLERVFPGSRIEKLETTIPDDVGLLKKVGRPRRYQNPNDRKVAYRQRLKQKDLADLLRLNEAPYPLVQESLEVVGESGDKKGIEDSYTNFVPNHATATVYRGKKSGNPLGYFNCENTDEFISGLKSWHSRALRNKEDNFLISPAIFDPNHPNREPNDKGGYQQKGRNNICYLQHIWLDFENGDLKPDEIADLFPHLRLVVFNTFNHTAAEPRFRVIFLTSQQCTPDDYEILWDNIAVKIEDSGYWVKKEKRHLRPSGLDCFGRSPHFLFFAPCQSKKNPADSFFRYYNEPDRQLLDP
jgi:hypothetical protein